MIHCDETPTAPPSTLLRAADSTIHELKAVAKPLTWN